MPRWFDERTRLASLMEPRFDAAAALDTPRSPRPDAPPVPPSGAEVVGPGIYRRTVRQRRECPPLGVAVRRSE